MHFMEDNQHNDTLTVDLLRLIQNTPPQQNLWVIGGSGNRPRL